MRTFRLLQPAEIECRISEIDRNGKYLTLLLYKTARTDAAMLDEKFGPLGWANDYRVIDGKMYCGIGVRSGEANEWVWKWNVGTESNTEAEKGEASDAMKRAGFVWGIGTELYSAPRIVVWSNSCEIKEKAKGGYGCYDKFSVSKIAYGDREQITELEIVNAKTGKVVYTFKDGKTPAPQKEQKKADPPADGPAPGKQTALGSERGAFRCRKCGCEVDEETAAYSKDHCEGMVLCREHQVAYFNWKMNKAGAQ